MWITRRLHIAPVFPVPSQNMYLLDIILLLLHTAPFLFLLVFLIAEIPCCANSSSNGPAPLQLLARNQIPRTQHPNIVPPLHHIFSAPRPETPRVLARPSKEPERPPLRRSQTVLPSLDVELVRLCRRQRRRPQCTRRKEQRKHRRAPARRRRVGCRVLVQEPSRREDKVRLTVHPSKPFLALQ